MTAEDIVSEAFTYCYENGSEHTEVALYRKIKSLYWDWYHERMNIAEINDKKIDGEYYSWEDQVMTQLADAPLLLPSDLAQREWDRKRSGTEGRRLQLKMGSKKYYERLKADPTRYQLMLERNRLYKESKRLPRRLNQTGGQDE